MTDKSQVVAATVIGAAVGAIAGYIFFTTSGRSLRRQLEPALGDLGRELKEFRATVVETASVATGGWKLLLDLIGDNEARTARYSPAQQSRPF